MCLVIAESAVDFLDRVALSQHLPDRLFEREKLANFLTNFFRLLNEVHPALTFTMESESQGQLPFMDVGIQRTDSTIVRSVYRKLTFTGLYTRWDSF